MEKNVRVLDENGNEYGTTWPKRARGLVKKGRARYASDDAIVLRAPPSEKEHLEEKIMSEQNTDIEYSIPYILRQIAAIQADTAHLSEVAEKLAAMSDGDSGEPGSPGNIQGQAKARALETVITCRETTNQQLLRFYEKMYDDLTGRSPRQMYELVTKD